MMMDAEEQRFVLQQQIRGTKSLNLRTAISAFERFVSVCKIESELDLVVVVAANVSEGPKQNFVISLIRQFEFDSQIEMQLKFNEEFKCTKFVRSLEVSEESRVDFRCLSSEDWFEHFGDQSPRIWSVVVTESEELLESLKNNQELFNDQNRGRRRRRLS